MKALSILQPWAWLIANGYKPYENRTWSTSFRGEFLIHAGKGFDQAGYDWVRETFPEIPLPGKDGDPRRAKDAFPRGGIVGKGILWEVATASSSPWFSGPLGFCIARPEPIPIIPYSGKLGFFDVPDSLLATATTHLATTSTTSGKEPT